MKQKIIDLIILFRTHRRVWWIIVYSSIYMIGFQIMEGARHVHYHVIHTWLDDQIPFFAPFIVPYVLWFAFNVIVVAYFVLHADRHEYYRLITALMLGMTAFLVISVVYPNRLELRPETVDTGSIFGRAVAALYGTDTPTNVLPSIHVYNTVVLCHAVNMNARLRRRRVLLVSCNIFSALIVLSTMFLKQHSVIDVSLGLVLAMVMQLVSDRIFETEEESFFNRELARSDMHS